MPSHSILSEDLLERCAQRAAVYDRENRFFFEDFEELRALKYLLGPLPTEFGGAAATFREAATDKLSAPTRASAMMRVLTVLNLRAVERA